MLLALHNIAKNYYVFFLPLIVLFLCFMCFFALIYARIKEKAKLSDTFAELYTVFARHKIIFSILYFFSFLVFMFSESSICYFLGGRDIDLIPEGTYCYYVRATNESSKTYTLPAKINKVECSSIWGDSKFYIENVYFPNGGYLYFGDINENPLAILPENHVALLDQDTRAWEIEITNNSTNHERVKETTVIKIWPIIRFAISETVITVFYIIFLIKYFRTKRKVV